MKYLVILISFHYLNLDLTTKRMSNENIIKGVSNAWDLLENSMSYEEKKDQRNFFTL